METTYKDGSIYRDNTTSNNIQIGFPSESILIPSIGRTVRNITPAVVGNSNSRRIVPSEIPRDDKNYIIMKNQSTQPQQKQYCIKKLTEKEDSMVAGPSHRNFSSSACNDRNIKSTNKYDGTLTVRNHDDNFQKSAEVSDRAPLHLSRCALSQVLYVSQNPNRRHHGMLPNRSINFFSSLISLVIYVICSCVCNFDSIEAYSFVATSIYRKTTITLSHLHPYYTSSDNQIISSLHYTHSRRRRISTWVQSQREDNNDDVVIFDDKDSKIGDDGSDDDIEWHAILASLTMYKAAYGDLKVPQRFIVPNLAPWPKPAWGLKLGKVVAAIRGTGKFIDSNGSSSRQTLQRSKQRKSELDRLGFVWSVRRNNNADSEVNGIVTLEQIVVAASTYRKLFITDDDARSVLDVILDNYVVPDTEPWPEPVRGLPLGRQLALVEQQCPPAIRAKLAQLKILPMAEEQQDVVSKTSKTPSPNSVQETDDEVITSTSSSANDLRFEKVFLALKTYKALYGDLLVPQPFSIPSRTKEWPEETWGLRLGARVNAIRSQGTFVNSNPERRQMLDNLGFAWSPPKEQRGRRGRKPKESEELQQQEDQDVDGTNEESKGNAINSLYGEDVDVRPASVNDDNDDETVAIDSFFDGSFDFGPGFSPSPTSWNFEKGATDTASENISSSSNGISTTRFSSPLGSERDTATMRAAAAAKIDVDEYIPPRTFAESLAEATQLALDVGVIDGMTPAKRVIKGKREKDIPWFNDDFGEYFVFEDVVEALTTYKAMYGTFANMSDAFVIPTPQEVTGFINEYDDFGDPAFGDDNRNNIFDSYNMEATTRQAVMAAEDERDSQEDSKEDWIAAEIKRLQQETITDDGPTTVAITAEQSPKNQYMTTMSRNPLSWGEHLAGMRLGNIVSRIRDGSLEVKHIPERKTQLDAIGFEWGDPKYFIDVPFEKAMCAMYAYYLIRGDMFVDADYVMPDEDPWPQALAGYELGTAVKRIRELQNFLEAYHPDKVSLLRMIDFVWFSDTVALPLDPNEKEMTSETLLLSAMGHPDYAKMIDIPMGLPDKIIADGPFMETDDDPKLWWRKWHNWDYVNDYWYQQGRRDNAYVLRRMGYPQMADEHEAKYGIGMFKQMDQIFDMLEKRDDSGGINNKSLEEKKEVLEQLDYFRQELIGCTDVLPRERDKLIADIDTYIMLIMKGIDFDSITGDGQDIDVATGDDAFYAGKANGKRIPGVSDDTEDDEHDGPQIEEIYEEEEINLEDELGFGKR